MFKKITIVGVGLIGGSIGLAVKKRKLAREVIGVGRRAVSIRKALRKKAIDKGLLDLKKGVCGADLIIIATAVDKVMPKIKEVTRYADKGAIIIDVNSTKEKVVSFANRVVKRGLFFVGTHPLAGSEQSGVLHAEKDLFKDSVCIITPAKKTNKNALEKIKKFWKALGARVEVMSPASHDKAVSNISHLPHILSYALCNSVLNKELRLTGSGFKDTTRIAKSNPNMWSDIFMQNKRSILESILKFKKELSLLESGVRSSKKLKLTKALISAKKKRDLIG
ncbi:MAG: prephenate dehydrogenase [Candidatus Omnitrophica bacterium]|nr:prephenate dehydrogenase [Candidatus Omnitrophota bacterium]